MNHLPRILVIILCINQVHAASTTSSVNRTSPVAVPAAKPGTTAGLQTLEQEFMRWVAYIEWRQHSAYPVAQKQLVAHSYIVVDKRPGVGHFSTIQAAIDSVPQANVLRVKILITAGTYTEKVFIPYTKPFITLQGFDSNSTIIEWGDTADKRGAEGNPIGTYNSATVAIDAPYFIAKNITFKNKAPVPAPGSNNQQAVALRISGDAAVFLGCQFLGAQDTLYDHKGRHFFQDCYVEGSVDFIFGDGLSMYKGCHLHAIGAPYQALTAQNRASPQDNSGFSFVNCKVTGSGPLYLGRAWGTFSRVVYSFTFMDNIIIPKGWNDWGDPKRQATVYYGQFRCYGPGANAVGRVSWSKELTQQEAQPFLELSFIDGTEWFSD